jgi:HK97 gp10 family phage protein
MNDVDINLLGDDELLAALRELDQKTQLRYLKRVVSDSANIYVKAARRQVPVRRTKLVPPPVKPGKKRSLWHPPGTGKKSIGKKMGRSKRTATVFVGPRTGTGDKRKDGWYLKFPEYGTKKLSPHFWFRIAYGANKDKVEQNQAQSIRKILTKVWNKHARR